MMNINLYKINKYRYKLGLNLDENNSVNPIYLQKYIYYLTGGANEHYEKYGQNIIFLKHDTISDEIYSNIVTEYYLIIDNNRYLLSFDQYESIKKQHNTIIDLTNLQTSAKTSFDQQAIEYFTKNPNILTITLQKLKNFSRSLPSIPSISIKDNQQFNLQQIMNQPIYSNQPESIQYFIYIPINKNITDVRIFSTEKKADCINKDKKSFQSKSFQSKSFHPTYYKFTNCTFDINSLQFTFNNTTDTKIKLEPDAKYIRTCLAYDTARTYYKIDSSMIQK
jgi:hypothetical protein